MFLTRFLALLKLLEETFSFFEANSLSLHLACKILVEEVPYRVGEDILLFL
jgi:hypothetical protein